MKIRKAEANSRKRCFEITTEEWTKEIPFSRMRLVPTKENPVVTVYSDPELNHRGFTYVLASGEEDSVPLDAVLEYNRDPGYMRDMLLFKLTCHAKDALKKRKFTKREVIRRMGTTPTQFYRLMDTTFYGKTIDQMIRLLAALDEKIEITFKKVA